MTNAMPPGHRGTFVRTELLDEIGPSLAEAAQVSGVRHAPLSDLVNGNASLAAA